METTQSKVSQKVETKKELHYLTLPEIIKDHLDLVNKEFPKYPVKFIRTFNRSKREQTTINVEIHPIYLKALTLRDGNDYINPIMFASIALDLGLKYQNDRGYEVTEWNRNVPIRFITGSYSVGDGKYKALQIVFSKDNYFTHLFNYDEVKLIDKLIATNQLKVIWNEVPDKLVDPNLDVEV